MRSDTSEHDMSMTFLMKAWLPPGPMRARMRSRFSQMYVSNSTEPGAGSRRSMFL